jgi:hypothetical protein
MFTMFQEIKSRQRGWEWDSTEMDIPLVLGKYACFPMEEK